ncbi:hypothetical protein [Nonomuraea sp. LPB2021202275-12-8]|uniref:hypothetical protein n=1 Tax=Nonomuraea sp. LPB2021202275-12-8 TaxID=3120159 RepID=UPI00300C60DF
MDQPSPPCKTVYVSIGNSDDKLSQREWADFVREVGFALMKYAGVQHGFWLSPPHLPWQNACWCVEVAPSMERPLRAELAQWCGAYRQDSIAWAEATTDFITPSK